MGAGGVWTKPVLDLPLAHQQPRAVAYLLSVKGETQMEMSRRKLWNGRCICINDNWFSSATCIPLLAWSTLNCGFCVIRVSYFKVNISWKAALRIEMNRCNSGSGNQLLAEISTYLCWYQPHDSWINGVSFTAVHSRVLQRKLAFIQKCLMW